MKSLTKPLKDIAVLTTSLTLAFILALAANFVYGAWSNPPAAAPGSNVAAPVNVGGDRQNKSGTFGAGSLNSFVISANTRMQSPRYCDQNGANCFSNAEVTKNAPPQPPVCTGSEKALQWNGTSWSCASVGSTVTTFSNCTSPNRAHLGVTTETRFTPGSQPRTVAGVRVEGAYSVTLQCLDGSWEFIRVN